MANFLKILNIANLVTDLMKKGYESINLNTNQKITYAPQEDKYIKEVKSLLYSLFRILKAPPGHMIVIKNIDGDITISAEPLPSKVALESKD